ncbi:RNA-binding protein [Striga asiatica]|uniref:RNA-binding protein n=1 Tax=Striga asiatica TaxID=4170 RepID=A0A5A7QIX6_STRAF|nr:RNA-binding protein [Striga asiatica]
MAFLNRVGALLKHNVSKHITPAFSASNPSFFQAIRSMSTNLTTKLFVGGLGYRTDEQTVRDHFSRYGDVDYVKIITDRETGYSRGFGFVTFSSAEAASSAIQGLDGQDLDGRRITVNYAKEKPREWGYGGGNGGGYGTSGDYSSGGGGGNYSGGGNGSYSGNVGWAGGGSGGFSGGSGDYSGGGNGFSGGSGNNSSSGNGFSGGSGDYSGGGNVFSGGGGDYSGGGNGNFAGNQEPVAGGGVELGGGSYGFGGADIGGGERV